MFHAIRAIATEFLRTQEVSLQKDAARSYGGRERPSAGGLNPSRSEAAVVRVGSRARAMAERGGEQPSTPPFQQLLRGAQARNELPSIDLLGRAVQASAEPFVSFGGAALLGQVVPYEALRFAAASQDPSFASDPPLKAFTGLPLPLLGDEAISVYDQSALDDDEHPFERSVRASEPFGREVPFDLQNPDGEAEGVDGASDDAPDSRVTDSAEPAEPAEAPAEAEAEAEAET